MPDLIRVRNARQHNLKGISVDLPRRAITVITGPSGSGKSSFAFDTVYAEGQRRYVESLSAYARQFLERMQKPLVDSIDGLSPAIAIEQRNPVRTSRSTVGTATEIYDYLRLLWARIGRTLCPICHRELRPDTPQGAADRVLELPAGTRLLVTFPLRLSDLVSHAVAVENLRAEGFVRVVADGVAYHVDDLAAGTPDLTRCREVLVVTDRLTADISTRTRLTDAIETAFRDGDGDCVVAVDAPPDLRGRDRLRLRAGAPPGGGAHGAARPDRRHALPRARARLGHAARGRDRGNDAPLRLRRIHPQRGRSMPLARIVTSNPEEIAYLCEYLRSRGYSIELELLVGIKLQFHGRNPTQS